jgi:Uma2 family endonuclease
MSRLPDPAPLPEGVHTLAEFSHWLGDVSAERIHLRPPPGMAGANDVLKLARHENRLCELVCGTLIEKRLGYKEMTVAAAVMAAIEPAVAEKKLGVVTGPEGSYRLGEYLVRYPSVAFCAEGTYRGDGTPGEAAAGIVPQLVVEVNDGISEAELTRKLGDYFEAGVKQVWVIDLDRRAGTAYSSLKKSVSIPSRGAFDAGRLLRGLKVPLAALFGQRATSGNK